jgi:hypothetical protein
MWRECTDDAAAGSDDHTGIEFRACIALLDAGWKFRSEADNVGYVDRRVRRFERSRWKGTSEVMQHAAFPAFE